MKPLSKILIVNKYHFISGGAERYFLSIMESLRQRGVEPIPFSVNYSRSLPTPYQKYFISPVVPNSAAKIKYMKPSLKQRVKLAARAIYSWEAKRAITDIIQTHKPDVAYFLNFNNHISPSAIDACYDQQVPVVMRMSDFNLVCASNMYYRDGHPCTDCKSSLHHAIKNRCVHGSWARSLVQVTANSIHRWMKVYQKVDAFIAPTEFMKQDLIESGFSPDRIHCIRTFKKACSEPSHPDEDAPYVLFMGRFVPYKGVEAAIRAFSALAHPKVVLKLVGDEDDDESARLKKLVNELGSEKTIQFLPFQRDAQKLHQLVHRSLFTLVPSEFYENLPHTILEAFACGRPVIATRLGSIPDIVHEGKLGLLFKLGDQADFSEKIRWLIEHPIECEKMGEAARLTVLKDYSEQGHLDQLLKVFQKISSKDRTLESTSSKNLMQLQA